MSDDLRGALDRAAEEILGEHVSEGDERDELLRGAALLTGRADTAQDAKHVGLARAHLGSDEGPDPTRVQAEVLWATRAAGLTIR